MRVASLGMTPVKCTGFHQLQEAYVARRGMRGDRAFILLDKDGLPVSSSKHAAFLLLRISFDQERGTMTALLPDGRQVSETLQFGEPEPLDYMGMREIIVRPVLGGWSALFSKIGRRSVRLVRPEIEGDGIDVKPITLMTTGSLRALEARLGAAIDLRRFRANLVIEADQPHAEDGWEGRDLRVGGVVLKVLGSVPRCIVTQFHPETGVNDTRTIPALMSYRAKVGLPDGLMPVYRTPGFASYAEVVQPGDVAVGDGVQLI
jgi:uncharacterized protein YcbX